MMYDGQLAKAEKLGLHAMRERLLAAASGDVIEIGAGTGLNLTCYGPKGRNLLGNQKVSLLVVDPGNTSRFIQIRGDAELGAANAREHHVADHEVAEPGKASPA